MDIYIPIDVFLEGMDFSENENPNRILSHIILGLVNKGLLSPSYSFGPTEHIQKTFKDAHRDGAILKPTALGAELFLWAFGLSDLQPTGLLEENLKLENDISINIKNGSKRINYKS